LHSGLSSYLKSVSAFGANDVMLSLCLGKAEDGLAGRTLPVHMSFSVLPFIFSELEKTGKSLIFSPSLDDIFRHHSKKGNTDKRPRQKEIPQIYEWIDIDEY
jgi:hypothetical protein